jgi:hypothetical protein
MRTLALVLLASASVGCSSTSTTTPSSSSGDKGETTDTELVASSAEGLFAVEAAVVAADTAFEFDPTLDPAADAATNVENVRAHAATAPCAKVSATTDTVTLDLGSKCIIGAETLSGAFTVRVTKTAATTTLALDLTDVSVSGMNVSGTASFATTNGTSFAVTVDLTSGASHVTGNVTATGINGTLRLDGSLTASTFTMRVDGVTYVRGQCYATTGSVEAQSQRGVTTYDFEALTPTNSQVAVTKDGAPRDSVPLPPYGSCGI